MAEQLDVYDLNGDFIKAQDRDEYYAQTQEEYLNSGKVTHMVKTVRAMLLTSDGGLYIQRRSGSSGAGEGLLDKTFGGHVKTGHSWSLSVTAECAEELSIPASLDCGNNAALALRAKGRPALKNLKKGATSHRLCD